MNFKLKLGGFKAAIDKQLELYFDKAILEAEKKDVLIAEALRHTKIIALAGGKRIRGALIYNAYLGFGGKEKTKILKIAAAIELVHLFLLMHDDIIDRGQLRHGEMTLHEMFAKKYAKKGRADAAEHFGESMAIIVGEYLYVQAQEMILDAGFDRELTISALSELQAIVATTIIGQAQDIYIAFDEKNSEQQILNMYENKTARYTFEGPLKLGAIFAECYDKKTLALLSGYAVPLGIAFQIQDDILGVFGKTGEMGKSDISDIEEGKKTLMVVKALSESTPLQRKELQAILGKKKINSKELNKFKEILISTESLKACQELANEYFKTGEEELEKIVMLGSQKKFLSEMINYLENRKV